MKPEVCATSDLSTCQITVCDKNMNETRSMRYFGSFNMPNHSRLFRDFQQLVTVRANFIGTRDCHSEREALCEANDILLVVLYPVV